jgi:dipeptidyl aminopeptidase/acylaminoacyl peptidase
MRFKLLTAYCSLLTVLLSCAPTPQTYQTSLIAYRFSPPAFVEFSAGFQTINEIPFPIPLNCGLFDVFPAPIGEFLLIELSCPNGQAVLFLDTSSASVTQPVTDSDSHFLAWAGDGRSVYLKVDALGDAHVVRAHTSGKRDEMDLSGWTYDLSSKPDSEDFIFTFSRGLGYGSELNFAQRKGRNSQPLYADQFNYISFARYSPDGSKIAFIKIPDSQTPFTVGELWVMDADGSNLRKLADADAGHGYAANWSVDGEWIAFVKRENPRDEGADQSSDSLISNVYRVNVLSGELTQVTFLTAGRVETPHWSPDGHRLAFNKVLNGRMEVQIADIPSGEIRSLMTESTCCPAWMRK